MDVCRKAREWYKEEAWKEKDFATHLPSLSSNDKLRSFRQEDLRAGVELNPTAPCITHSESRAGLTSVSSPVEANGDLCPGYIQTSFPAQGIHRKIPTRSGSIMALPQTRVSAHGTEVLGSTVVSWGSEQASACCFLLLCQVFTVLPNQYCCKQGMWVVFTVLVLLLHSYCREIVLFIHKNLHHNNGKKQGI